jgi:hypothetical protein
MMIEPDWLMGMIDKTIEMASFSPFLAAPTKTYKFNYINKKQTFKNSCLYFFKLC